MHVKFYLLILLSFTACQLYSQKVTTYTANALMGLETESGLQITPAIFSDIQLQSKYEYATVKQDGKWGVINLKGAPLTPIKYDKPVALKRGYNPRIENETRNFDYSHFEGKMTWQNFRHHGHGDPFMPYPIPTLLQFAEGISIVQANRLYGAVDKYGKEIIPTKYEELSNFVNGIVQVKKNGQWGIMNKAEKMVLPCVYESIFFFQNTIIIAKRTDGMHDVFDWDITPITKKPSALAHMITYDLLMIKQDNLFGLFNVKTNNLVLPPKFNSISLDILWGPGLIVTTNEGSGVYSKKGVEIIKPIYQNISRFGIHFKVCMDNKCGVFDENGMEIIPIKYAEITLNPCRYYLVKKEKEGLFAIANQQGKIFTKFEYSKITGCDDTYINVVYKEEEWLIDTSNRKIAQIQCEYITQFSKLNMIRVTNGKHGLYSKEGKEILKPNYELLVRCGDYFCANTGNTYSFYTNEGTLITMFENQSIVRSKHFVTLYSGNYNETTQRIYDLEKKQNIVTIRYNNNIRNSYDMYDKNDRLVLTGYNNLRAFEKVNETLFVSAERNKKMGILNAEGQTLVPLIYNTLQYLYVENNSLVSKGKVDKYEGVIDQLNNELIPFEYDRIDYQNEDSLNWFFVEKKGRWGLINEQFNEIIPPRFDSIYLVKHFDKPYFVVKQNNQESIFDPFNNRLLPFKYKKLTPIRENTSLKLIGFIAKQDDKYALLDKEGILLTPFKFDELSSHRYTKEYGTLFIGRVDGFEDIYNPSGEILNFD